MIYCPDNCEEHFKNQDDNEQKYNSIVGNRDRSIIAIITDSHLYFYLAELRLLAASFGRGQDEVNERGTYKRAFWNYNSTSICVLTSANSLYIYSIETSTSTLNLNNLTDVKFQSPECYIKQKIANINVKLSVVAKFENIPLCLTVLKDDLFIGLTDGWLHRISWNGDVISSFRMCDVPFAVDKSLNRVELPNLHPAVHPIDAVFCPLLGGICVIINDGRAAFLTSPTLDFKLDLTALWLPGLNDAVCCEVNHRYRLIYFATKSGSICCYSLDDTNGTLFQVFRVQALDGSEMECIKKSSAPIRSQIRSLPQGTAFVVAWNIKSCKSSLCLVEIYTTFGARSWRSVESSTPSLELQTCNTASAEWGPEGYQLWVHAESNLSFLDLVHSVAETSSMILVGDDRFYSSPLQSHETKANAPHVFWKVQRFPHEYLSSNRPIRFLASDPQCSRVIVVSGRRGFCYFDVKIQKWRLFRKEAQEQMFHVTGGLVVFQNYILCAANRADDDSECIFAFDLSGQLDLDTASSIPTQRVLLLNLSNEVLITFDVNSAIRLYNLFIKISSTSKTSLSIVCLAEICITEFLPHPMCVISIHLMKLNYHPDASTFSGEYDSILLNVGGNLLLLNPMNPDGIDSALRKEQNKRHLYTPTLIASSVERIWSCSCSDRKSLKIPYLNKALWINSGTRIKMWLPLYDDTSRSNYKNQSFTARRIMLPMELNIYPLSLDDNFLASGILAVSHELDPKNSSTTLNMNGISRVSKVFIHYVIKQLLMRNLGNFAMKIASACRPLPYFEYILELLLHNILDEEATSVEPIPDPLLPTVVSFIHEFPEYLRTIIHCARKTELAHWNLLFSVTHHPRQLFHMCLKEDLLDTAIAALIVLQSMESTVEGAKHAILLLEEVLNKKRWSAARDIVLFIRETLADELDNDDDTPESPLYQKLMSANSARAMFSSHKSSLSFDSNMIATDEHRNFNHSSDSDKAGFFQQRSRTTSKASPGQAVFNTPKSIAKRRDTSPIRSSDSTQLSIRNKKMTDGKPSLTVDVPDMSIENTLEELLYRCATNLLECFALKDLLLLDSYVPLDLQKFFKKLKFTLSPSSFPVVLMKLHSQFSWPYPVSHIASKSTRQAEIPEMAPNDATDSWSLCSSSAVGTEIIGDTSTLDGWVLESSSNNKACKENGSIQMQKITKETEIEFAFDQLIKFGAFGWAYFICIIRRDTHLFYDLTLRAQAGERKTSDSSFINREFIDSLYSGTVELQKWAEQQCQAYVPILRAFKEFMESTSNC